MTTRTTLKSYTNNVTLMIYDSYQTRTSLHINEIHKGKYTFENNCRYYVKGVS